MYLRNGSLTTSLGISLFYRTQKKRWLMNAILRTTKIEVSNLQPSVKIQNEKGPQFKQKLCVIHTIMNVCMKIGSFEFEFWPLPCVGFEWNQISLYAFRLVEQRKLVCNESLYIFFWHFIHKCLPQFSRRFSATDLPQTYILYVRTALDKHGFH